MSVPLSEAELKRRYDDHVAQLGATSEMPQYHELNDHARAMWRAIEEQSDAEFTEALEKVVTNLERVLTHIARKR